MRGCSGGGGTRRQGTGTRTAAGAEAGHDKGGSRQGTWALLACGARQSRLGGRIME